MITAVALLFITLAAVGVGWSLWAVFAAAKPEIVATLVTASATILASVLTIRFTKKAERDRELEQEQRKQRIPAYEEFVELLFRVLMSSKTGEKVPTEQETTLAITRFTQN